MNKLILSAIILALIICFAIVVSIAWAEPAHLAIAQSEIGKGESESNNRGPDIKRYGQGKDGQPWCATFVAYCLNEAGISDLGYPVAAKVIWNKGRKAGWQVKEPQPGDLICFWRVKPSGWQGHAGIIAKVGKTEIMVIEGNLGDFPSLVKAVAYPKTDIPRLLGYLRPQKGK